MKENKAGRRVYMRRQFLCLNPQNCENYRTDEEIQAVASLKLVSPVGATHGVTPIFP